MRINLQKKKKEKGLFQGGKDRKKVKEKKNDMTIVMS